VKHESPTPICTGKLPLAEKMSELEPTSSNEAELAFLIYNQSMYQSLVMPRLAGRRVTPDVLAAHREHISDAINENDGERRATRRVARSSRT